ncbi:hypothetical protein [uncultured Kordia sp.]|uniref:lipase family protein n=1 Tax=uncultured Kordia sp. TaxID=507699 RepID=UPI002609ED5F|nr:hypothetical protein [uncultured Kordia sp.]
MKPLYNKTQIIHSLSFASNSAFKKVFEDESTCKKSYEKLQNFVTEVSKKVFLDETIKKLIGDDWETVWGPVVYSHDHNSSFAVADNTMGAYYSKSQNLFVIAIAGTNSISSYGWIQEDFHVNKTAVWKDISGKGYGDISQGTATGLNILRNTMKYKNKNLLTGLKDFIIRNDVKLAEVAVTGHSLGGALSPALALYLSDKQSEWDPKKTMNISTYPTAGPTIGVHKVYSWPSGETGKSFTDYFEEQIKKNRIKCFGIKNSLDIVPLAWNRTDLATIPSLYKNEDKDKNIEDVSFGNAALIAVLNLFKKSNKTSEARKQYIYKHIKGIELKKGTFDDKIDNIIKDKFKLLKGITKLYNSKYIPKSLHSSIGNLENITRFFGQAAYQHTTAYAKLLNIEVFLNEFTTIINSDSATDKEQHDTQMVIEMANEALGFDINSLLELSELTDEELEKLIK